MNYNYFKPNVLFEMRRNDFAEEGCCSFVHKKKFLAGALLTLWGVSALPAVAAEDTMLQLIINNQLYTQTAEQAGPQLINERVYVPLRLVSESLGYRVQWHAEQREIVIVTEGDNEPHALGEPVAEDAPITIVIDGQRLAADENTGQPFLNGEGYTMIPLRLVGEALHCDVQWQDGVAIVNERQPEPVTPPAVETDTEDSEEEGQYYNLTIQGDSIATAQQLNAYLERKEPDIRAMMERNYPEQGFTPFPDDIAELYISLGEKYNIRGDLAFAQALKETGYFQFYGSVEPFQNNFCGLGASGIENTGEEALNGVDSTRVYSIPGLHGLTYLTVADGVEAHLQHLYAYTSTEELPEGCELLDPRFGYVKRGVAKTWTDLDGRWAIPGNGYGESIIKDYWQPALMP